MHRFLLFKYRPDRAFQQSAVLMALVWLVLASACRTGEEIASSEQGPTPPYRIVGYVHRGETEALRRIGAEQLTHLNYAFANVTSAGDVILEAPEDSLRLAALNTLRSKNPALKILLSIGGWSWSDHFSDAARTQASRERFARSAIELMIAHSLDGLDIDWEYPGQPGEGNVYRQEDKQHFTLLLQTLRTYLDRQGARDNKDRYLLTIAAGANLVYLEHTEMSEAQQYLDFINLMTYDFHGSWTPHTGHLTNLYPSEATPVGQSVATAVSQYLDEGVPAHKIVLGAAFYGRGWTGVTPVNQGLGQPYTGQVRGYAFATLQDRYIGKQGYRRYWDEGARAPYLWNPDSLHFISYEDEISLRYKAAYVTTQALGGIMYWQHGHDPSESLLGVLYQNLW